MSDKTNNITKISRGEIREANVITSPPPPANGATLGIFFC